MSENNNQRPHSRRRRDSGKETEVYKRDEALGGGPSGNAKYDREEPKQESGDRAGLEDIVELLEQQAQQQSSQQGQNLNNLFTNNSQSANPFGTTSGGGRKKRGGGGSILLLLLAAFLLFGGGNLGNLFGGGTATATPTPTPTPKPTATPAPTTNPLQNLFNFGTQQSHTQQYVDASSNAVNASVASGTREKYTQILGNNQDKVTILVYMCGTDLESNYGMATSDISEMSYANMSNNVNIIIETGGTKKWQNSVISNRTNQRWRVTQNALEPLDQNMGAKAMTDPNTLADFIKFGVQNYPANRYMLILWDHGAGSVSGYCYDEYYPNDTMSVDEIASALKVANTKFDFIGFDACLMANMEAAIAIEPYADYMIASEETEPGTGWYYTNWLSMLAQNSSTPTLDFGKQLVDDFVARSQRTDKTTLSIVDLAEFKNTVPTALKSFSKKISSDVKSNNYQSVADARSATREFAQSNRLDQIDLVHFCEQLGTTEGKSLSNAIKSCVKYNKTSNVTNAYGISIYFPYRVPNKVNQLLKIYDNIDFDSDYGDAVRSFATLEASGQIVTNGTSNSIFDLLQGGSTSNSNSTDALLNLFLGGGQQQTPSYGGLDLSSLLGGGSGNTSAYDISAVDLFSSFFRSNHIESSDFILTEKNGQKVLALDPSAWEMIHDVALNVWVDDGTGYIDLGLDNIFEFNEDGDLIIDYDGKWLSINDHVVSYYLLSDEYVSDSKYRTTGYVPALLNGEEVKLILEWTNDNPDGSVLGAQKVYENGMEAKGLIEIQDGDTIDYICDYYDYNGQFNNRYPLGEPYTVDGDLEIYDIGITNDKILYGYQLTDMYNAARWTPMVTYDK